MAPARVRSPTAATVVRSLSALALCCALASAYAAEPVDFAVTTIDGHPFRLADFRGRWVLVNWWATWCGACVAEMPALSRFAEREPTLVVVGLTDEALDADALRTFLAAHPVGYPIVRVDRAALPATLAPTFFGVAVRPISYVVAPDGTVAERIVGDVDPKKLAARIREGKR